MTELEPIISEAVSELGYRTEIFGSHNEDKPSVDCSHIVTYQVKKRGHKVKKFSTDFYLYSSEDIKEKGSEKLWTKKVLTQSIKMM